MVDVAELINNGTRNMQLTGLANCMFLEAIMFAFSGALTQIHLPTTVCDINGSRGH